MIYFKIIIIIIIFLNVENTNFCLPKQKIYKKDEPIALHALNKSSIETINMEN